MNRVVLSDLVNGKNIWMIERDYGMCFLLKPLQALRVSGKAHRQKFERGLATRDNVRRQIDIAHAAGADRFRNFVMTDRLADERIALPVLNDFGRKADGWFFDEAICLLA